MSHLHLVDGVLSPIWWVTGFALALAVLGFAILKLKKEAASKKVPYIGVVAALMLITMSFPLGFLPFHLNLTVLAGILAGPWLGFIAVFIVNLILGFIGHGGITVVGINTLIIGTEVILGYYIFSFLRNKIKPVTAVAITVIITLLISTYIMVEVVSVSNVGLVGALPHGHEENGHEAAEVGVTENLEEDHHEEEAAYQHEELDEVLSEVQMFRISGWSAVGLILLLGITIEALITALIVGYFLRVRSDLIIPPAVKETDEFESLAP